MRFLAVLVAGRVLPQAEALLGFSGSPKISKFRAIGAHATILLRPDVLPLLANADGYSVVYAVVVVYAALPGDEEAKVAELVRILAACPGTPTREFLAEAKKAVERRARAAAKPGVAQRPDRRCSRHGADRGRSRNGGPAAQTCCWLRPAADDFRLLAEDYPGADALERCLPLHELVAEKAAVIVFGQLHHLATIQNVLLPLAGFNGRVRVLLARRPAGPDVTEADIIVLAERGGMRLAAIEDLWDGPIDPWRSRPGSRRRPSSGSTPSRLPRRLAGAASSATRPGPRCRACERTVHICFATRWPRTAATRTWASCCRAAWIACRSPSRCKSWARPSTPIPTRSRAIPPRTWIRPKPLLAISAGRSRSSRCRASPRADDFVRLAVQHRCKKKTQFEMLYPAASTFSRRSRSRKSARVVRGQALPNTAKAQHSATPAWPAPGCRMPRGRRSSIRTARDLFAELQEFSVKHNFSFAYRHAARLGKSLLDPYLDGSIGAYFLRFDHAELSPPRKPHVRKALADELASLPKGSITVGVRLQTGGGVNTLFETLLADPRINRFEKKYTRVSDVCRRWAKEVDRDPGAYEKELAALPPPPKARTRTRPEEFADPAPRPTAGTGRSNPFDKSKIVEKMLAQGVTVQEVAGALGMKAADVQLFVTKAPVPAIPEPRPEPQPVCDSAYRAYNMDAVHKASAARRFTVVSMFAGGGGSSTRVPAGRRPRPAHQRVRARGGPHLQDQLPEHHHRSAGHPRHHGGPRGTGELHSSRGPEAGRPGRARRQPAMLRVQHGRQGHRRPDHPEGVQRH